MIEEMPSSRRSKLRVRNKIYAVRSAHVMTDSKSSNKVYLLTFIITL